MFQTKFQTFINTVIPHSISSIKPASSISLPESRTPLPESKRRLKGETDTETYFAAFVFRKEFILQLETPVCNNGSEIIN